MRNLWNKKAIAVKEKKTMYEDVVIQPIRYRSGTWVNNASERRSLEVDGGNYVWLKG